MTLVDSSLPKLGNRESRSAATRLSARAAALLFALLAVVSCSDADAPESTQLPASFAGATMGTTWVMKVPRSELKGVETTGLVKRAKEVLEGVNNAMSTYREHSELSRFNAAEENQWFSVSPELVGLVKRALILGETSQGAFDVTVGPVVNLWGFGPGGREPALPDDASIAAALSRTGLQHLECRPEPPALRKSLGALYVDLSATAKGYGVDRLVALLESEDIDSYFVEVGGEIRTRGKKDDGEPWRIAIERPEEDRRKMQRLLALGDRAIATSGDYRNFFRSGGRRFSHTIDPRTGRPVEHSLASVSVIADTCEEADAWATALMVLGPERGLQLARERDLVAYFIVRRDGSFEELESPKFSTEY